MTEQDPFQNKKGRKPKYLGVAGAMAHAGNLSTMGS